MRNALLRLVSIALFLTTAACERIVSVAVPSTAPRLVVEARLERVAGAVSGRQRVRLTASSDYFSATAPPPVRDAQVWVTDDSARSVTLTELPAEPGMYETTGLVVRLGTSYTLHIRYGGDEYASTELAIAGVPIDSLYFALRTDDVGPESGLRATISLTDPPGVTNYYLWDQFVDGRRVIRPDSESIYRVVASDDLQDGAEIIDFQPYPGVVVQPGKSVMVRQIALPAQAHRFFAALSEQTQNNGSPFGVAPANLRGNVANLTTPARNALGYFIVSEVFQRTRTVN